MITATMILCSMINVTECQGMGSTRIFTTEEACKAEQINAYEYFRQRNMLVMAYKCINWGEAA